MKLKNFFITLCAIFALTASNAFADEIVQADGTTIPCKIETVMDGLIEYRQNGSLHYFTRVSQSPIFSDYVMVKDRLFKKESLSRYTGRVVIKSTWSTTLLTDDNKYMEIPFFKVKFIGIYRP